MKTHRSGRLLNGRTLWCGLTAMYFMACLAVGGQAAAEESAQATPPNEQLIVLVQPEASALSKAFTGDTLPEIEKLAAEMGVGFAVVELPQAVGVAGALSVPEGVGITPLIAYQNHRGRSIYQGRYTTLDRVKNFMRTSKFLPQGEEPLVREALPVWDLGKAKVATPIKITELVVEDGGSAEGLDVTAQAMAEAIGSADERFAWRDRVELGRSDRLFYTDYYPYLAADGTLYVGLALYSQFHCHDPVFTLMDGSLHGPSQEAAEVFARGAKIFADEIARQLVESELGDGFDVLPSEAVAVSWDNLGLSLPPEPAGASAHDLEGVELGREWVVDQAAQAERPAVQFTFPAPLDAYAGEASSVNGTLTLGEGLSIVEMRGLFNADPSSVTLGESELDQAVHATMLEVAAYPESFFEIETVESVFEKPEFGQVAAAVLHGQFTMKGQTIPLSVPVSLEAFLGEDGKPRLSMDGRWEIRLLEPFGIEGPSGQPPANDTLIYTCYIVFESAEDL